MASDKFKNIDMNLFVSWLNVGCNYLINPLINDAVFITIITRPIKMK